MNSHIKKVSIPASEPRPVSRPWPDFPPAAQVGAASIAALQFGEEGSVDCVTITIEGRLPALVNEYAKLLNSPVPRTPRGARWERYPLHTLKNVGDSLIIENEPDKERVFSVASEFGRKLGCKFSTRNQGGGTFKITRVA